MSNDFDQIKAVGSVVIAERFDGMERTAGGIIVPDTASDQSRPPIWKVISVGPKCSDVKPGERVIFKGGMKLDYDSRTFVFLQAEELLGTLPCPKSVENGNRHLTPWDSQAKTH